MAGLDLYAIPYPHDDLVDALELDRDLEPAERCSGCERYVCVCEALDAEPGSWS